MLPAMEASYRIITRGDGTFAVERTEPGKRRASARDDKALGEDHFVFDHVQCRGRAVERRAGPESG